MEHYDLIVIGSGPAGERGAVQAAFFGKSVALIERAENMGGAGINTGTIPSKILREAALQYSGIQQRGMYQTEYPLMKNLSVTDFIHRGKIVVEQERKSIARNIQQNNIALFHGSASLSDRNTVVISSADKTMAIKGDVILIATGASPYHPPEVSFDGDLVFDSDTILNMTSMPKTMAVVGAGVIGTEYASIFAALGVHVTLIEPRERVLPFVDSEMIQRLMEKLKSRGVKFFLGHKMTSVEQHDNHIKLMLDKETEMEFDTALIASGRQCNVQGLGLKQVGVKVDEAGLIVVNDKYQTSIPNIYAAGDVIGFPALASTSMVQARTAMMHAFNNEDLKTDSKVLPLAVYSIPEISMVGLTEDECKAKRISHFVGRGYYENSPRGQIIGDVTGMIKLIFSPEDRKLLGAHIIGEQASELIHIAAHVMSVNGTIMSFIDSVYNYPTLSDLYKYAAYDGLENMEKWLKSSISD